MGDALTPLPSPGLVRLLSDLAAGLRRLVWTGPIGVAATLLPAMLTGAAAVQAPNVVTGLLVCATSIALLVALASLLGADSDSIGRFRFWLRRERRRARGSCWVLSATAILD